MLRVDRDTSQVWAFYAELAGKNETLTAVLSWATNTTLIHPGFGWRAVRLPLSSGICGSHFSRKAINAQPKRYESHGGFCLKKTLSIALLVSLAVLAAVQIAPALAKHQDQDNRVRTVTFHIELTGSQQVPPVTTDASGRATVRLIDNGTAISFRVVVCNIVDVIASHIHVGPTGKNGPVIIPFFGGQTVSSPHGCKTLASGIRTAADLNTKADPSITSWNDFVKALLAGNTYINVHTTANPMGEVRGQLVPHHENQDENEQDDE